MCDVSSIDLANLTDFGKPFKLSVWDFSGDPFYLNTIHHFLDAKALYLLTFDLSTYRTGDFQDTFAFWLDYVVARNNEVKLLVVGTHADLLNAATIKRICAEVENLIKGHFAVFKENIEKKIEAIEAVKPITSYMQEQLKHYFGTLKKVSTFVHSTQAVSSLSYDGFEQLIDSLTELASDNTLFPNGLQQIPSLWISVHDTVEDLAKKTRVPLLHIDEFQSKLISNHGMKNMMKDICMYLHDTGTIVWVHNDEKLKDYVFLRPRWLIDVIKSLIRNDMKNLDYEEMDEVLLANAVLKHR
ncbi:hypothetical protein EB796_015035 [Bugula neritina]|uniref:COR domain-containing protein n=1 Tax=Bugula neritina TaxID=10212 RepID=A0A7J7JJY8_BUGNE|nr:hypothetical protein EB796_015035 [Bugula neritina]